MICVSSGFRCSLLFLALFVASQTLAKDAANSVSSTATKRCNNVYNSFYAGPNRETETTLQEIKKILTHVEDDINILKENKTLATEPNKTVEALLKEMAKRLSQVQDDISILKGNGTLEKEPNKTVEILLQEMKKQLDQVKDAVKGTNYSTETLLQEMKIQLTQVQDDTSTLKKLVRKAQNCAELYKSGLTISGVYTIDPGDGSGAFDVFCDQTTAGGGWTVFQKRLDGSVDFYRGWADYKRGFGNLNGEFWLGLDKIHHLTKTTKNRLRIELEDTAGKTAYAEYNMFAVTSERTKYKLSAGAYSGTAGDSLTRHHGCPFSTKDQDNDTYYKSCASLRKGAWWYDTCGASNLNGYYYNGKHSSDGDGVNWKTWKGYYYSAKRAEMKIRPVHF